MRERRAKGTPLADVAATDAEYIAVLGQLRSAADRVHTARLGYEEALSEGK